MMYKEFWQRVNSLIKINNTTQKALSLQCGFNERRIETLSTYKRSPDVDEAVKIASALHTTVEYLVTGNQTQTNTTETLEEVKHLLQKALDCIL